MADRTRSLFSGRLAARVPTPGDNWRRVKYGLVALGGVVALGWVGYLLLGLDPLDSLYQTVMTVTTVGYGEVGEVDGPYKVFTIVLMLLGVGTALYTLGVLLEALLEGRLSEELRRYRMDQEIDRLRDHVIVCGLGQVGSAIVSDVVSAGHEVVVVDLRENSLVVPEGVRVIHGDATDDLVLQRAGLAHASTLVVAMDTDTSNVFVTLSARWSRPDLFIVARASNAGSEPKLVQAGADRVINPHAIGGSRMAALIVHPNVADFLDVVMHDRELEVRLSEVELAPGSPFCGSTLAACEIRSRAGVTVLGLRRHDGTFVSNPPPDSLLDVGDILIALGTADQHAALEQAVAG